MVKPACDAPVREDEVSCILLECTRLGAKIEEASPLTGCDSFERPDDVELDSLNTLWQRTSLRVFRIRGLVKHLAEEHQGRARARLAQWRWRFALRRRMDRTACTNQTGDRGKVHHLHG